MIDAQKHAALTAALAKGKGKHLGVKKQLNIAIPRDLAKEKRAADFNNSTRGKIGQAIGNVTSVSKNIKALFGKKPKSKPYQVGRPFRKKALTTALARREGDNVGMPRVRRALQGGDAQKAL